MSTPLSSSFFDKLFNPLSLGRANDDLVTFNYGKAEQVCYFLASVVLGTFTLGTLHLFHEGLHHYWRNRKVSESNPNNFQVSLNNQESTITRISKNQELEERKSRRSSSESSSESSLSTRSSPASPRHFASFDVVDKKVQCTLSQGHINKISEFLGKEVPKLKEFEQLKFEGLSDSAFNDLIPFMEEMQNDQLNSLGSQACAVICLKAMTSFFEKGLPKTEKDIYELIYEGISYYHEKEMKGQQVFSEIYEETIGITAIGPDMEEADQLKGQADIDSFSELLVLRQEYQGKASNLLNHLESITKKAVNQGRTCAVITTATEAEAAKNANATLVIMMDENNSLCLLDSHGSEGLGASLKFFKDKNGLTMYLQKEFFTNNDGVFLDGTFSIKVLNKQLP